MNNEAASVQKLQQKQAVLRVLIFTLVTVIIWIGVGLFRTQQSTGIAPELLLLAQPVNPNINEDVIARIEAKRVFSPQELSNFPINRLLIQNGVEVIVRGNTPPAPIPSSASSVIIPATVTPTPSTTSPIVPILATPSSH